MGKIAQQQRCIGSVRPRLAVIGHQRNGALRIGRRETPAHRPARVEAADTLGDDVVEAERIDLRERFARARIFFVTDGAGGLEMTMIRFVAGSASSASMAASVIMPPTSW